MGPRRADRGNQPRTIRVDKLERRRAQTAQPLRVDRVRPPRPIQKAKVTAQKSRRPGQGRPNKPQPTSRPRRGAGKRARAARG
jgi:hypothetical protein